MRVILYSGLDQLLEESNTGRIEISLPKEFKEAIYHCSL